MPHEPVCASHRQPESWLHCVGRFAYVSEHDDWHCPPVKRQALYVAQSVAVLPAQLKTQLPYPLTWHCASAAQFAWLPHDATHVPAVYMQLGLRVHGVCDAPDSVTAEHCVKHDWRFESHWHRGSVAHDACDGYATEHCSTHAPVLLTSQIVEAAHVVAVVMLVQAAAQAAWAPSHRQLGSLAQPTRVGCSRAHDVWHACVALLNWHSPLPTHAPSLLYVEHAGAHACAAVFHWHDGCATQ